MDNETVESENSGAAAQAETPGGMVLYLGDGVNYVEGVPARDLTREEWIAVSADMREKALATGLYHDPLGDSESVKPDNARKGSSKPK